MYISLCYMRVLFRFLLFLSFFPWGPSVTLATSALSCFTMLCFTLPFSSEPPLYMHNVSSLQPKNISTRLLNLLIVNLFYFGRSCPLLVLHPISACVCPAACRQEPQHDNLGTFLCGIYDVLFFIIMPLCLNVFSQVVLNLSNSPITIHFTISIPT